MTEPFAAVDVIRAKRDRGELTDAQIDWVVDGYTRGVVADEQMSALAMAILLNGMSRREVARWTSAMIASGSRMSWASLTRPTADKHSTGGVGDKITLPLAPLVAACGAAVPQLSGRGLGHTGGTLDKLESIPGFRIDLTMEEIMATVDKCGMVVAGQTANLVPADGKLYALRDVTATVPSLPLIASSIMSKKIAAGANGIVLDVKAGEGAFMKTIEEAAELARLMVGIGRDAGRDMVAVISDMNQPLGCAVGNALEVAEAIDTLNGGGPEDFREHCLTVAAHMVQLARGGEAQALAAIREEAAERLATHGENRIRERAEPAAVEFLVRQVATAPIALLGGAAFVKTVSGPGTPSGPLRPGPTA